MVYIRDNALHLTDESIAHRFNTRHDEDIVIEADAVLVLGGMATGHVTVQHDGLLVVKGMLTGSITVESGGEVLLADGAWARLPGKLGEWPVIDGRFVNPVAAQVEQTQVNDLSMLYRWDGVSENVRAAHMRAAAYSRG